MKPIHGDTVPNQSCSCTSCDYVSDSDQQSLRRLQGQASRIDRLFIDKYIPLRESKLLDKLIRTRALYDNIRNELLSSSLSVSSKTDIKPRQTRQGKTLEEVKKSSDILGLVDLVEKGSVLRSRKLSECCSCCRCNSKIRLHEHVQKGRRLRQAHVGGNITSRSSFMSRQGTGGELRLGKKFKAKNIKSDPCTCACDRELIKLQSRVIIKKIRPEQPIIERKPLLTITDKHKFMTNNNEKLRKPYRKPKRSKLQPVQYKDNKGEGFIKTVRKSNPSRDKLKLKRNKSIEQLKLIEQKIRENFESDRKFIPLKDSPVARIPKDNFVPVNTDPKLNLYKQKTTNNFSTGRKPISKVKFIHTSPAESIAADSEIRIKNKSAIKVKDKIGAQRQDWEFKRKGRKSRKSYQTVNVTKKKSSANTSSTSNGSFRKGLNFRIKNATKNPDKKRRTVHEPHDNVEIVKQPKKLRESRTAVDENQVRKTNESNFRREKKRSVKSMTNLTVHASTGVVQKPEKHLHLSSTKPKVLIKPRTKISGKLLKSISTSSMEKNRFSINRFKPSISHSIKMKLLDAPMRFEPRKPRLHNKPNLHKKPNLHNKPNLLKGYKQLEKPPQQKALHLHDKPHVSITKHTMKNIQTDKQITKYHSDRVDTVDRATSALSYEPDQIKIRSETKSTSFHGSKCECFDINISSKEKPGTKQRPSQIKVHSETKHTMHQAPSECACLVTISSKELKQGTKFDTDIANIPQITKSISRESNREVIKTSKLQPVSPNNHSLVQSTLRRASKCECHDMTITSKDNHLIFLSRSKYKPGQTNTYSDLKNSLGRTSREKRGILYNTAQNYLHASKCECPVIHIVTKEKRGVKFHPSYKYPVTNVDVKHQEKVELGLSAANLIVKTSKPRSRVELKGDYNKKKIQYKPSHISNTTGRSKYTITKHGVRRCLCTLKLAKTDKKKRKIKKKSIKSVTLPASVLKIPKTQLRNVSISTDREIYRTQMKQIRQPYYECDPGFCVPGECKPHECLERLSKNPIKKIKNRIRPLGGRNRKMKSNSSLTSRSLHVPKVKKVHSIRITHKSEDPIQILEKNTTKGLPDSLPHQVRPSFAITFLKRKPFANFDSTVGKDSEIETKIKKRILKDGNLEKDIKKHKSTAMQYKRPDGIIGLGPIIKRCLCTLKLHLKEKSTVKDSATSTDKGVKSTELKHSYQLKSYECEPHICVPGECLKYKCLERIKQRKNISSSKEFGITYKSKMISKSSDTRKLKSTSKVPLVQSDFQPQRNAIQTYKRMRKYSDTSNLPKNAAEIYSEKIVRHAVRIGSNFSFNIEFSKDLSPVNEIVKKPNNISGIEVEELLNQSNNMLKSQYIDVKPHHKRKFSPMLKKCLCTLKLLKNERQHLESKATPFITKKPTQVYAVNKVTVAKTKMNSPKILLVNEVDLRSHCVDSYYPNRYTKEALSQTKLWQYFKNKSSSILSISTIAFRSKQMHSYFHESKLLHIDPINRSLLDITSEETVRFQSKFRCQVNYSKNIHINKRILESAESQETIIDTITNPRQLTGVQPLLRRSYCTMNVQVHRPQGPKKRHFQHNQSKLKDYECEPGVCIPYECDPYECQKLIMKRLMRKVSRMSGTDRRLKNSSSLTSTVSSSSTTRKLQSDCPCEQKHHVAKARPTGLKYQTLPRPPKTKRQAVHVGSVFSFDIEFSKGRSKPAPVREYKVPKRPSTTRSSKTYDRHRRDRGTDFVRGRHDRESQSMIKQMRHRASSVTPMLKRCFCTLKLQKKGRQQKERERQREVINEGTSTPPKYRAEKQIFRTTGTGQNTKTKKIYAELLPYECEPNICVPGECDPYECLELIKKRKAKQTKEFGTDSMTSKITSSSSMTAGHKRTKRKHVQSRNIRAKVIKSRDTAVKSKPSVMSIESPRLPSRQAVRLGSSFSFNVEFYKDKTTSQRVADIRPAETYADKTPKEVRKVPKHVYVQKQLRESSSQDGKATRDMNSQIGLRKHGQSTMTSSFLKRCFCTAKLHGMNVDAGTKTMQNFGESISVLKRCFCTLKTFTTAKKAHHKTADNENEKVTPLAATHVGMTQTRDRPRDRLRERPPVLEPYECEPGVCIPGFCDPYECEKMIRRRRAKEKMVGTRGPRKKSTSSSFTSSRTSKARMTQSKYHARPTEKIKKQTRKEMVIKQKRRLPVVPGRQAVRIGSSFSFDIEFYKDKFPNYHQVQAAATTVKKSRPTRSKGHGANYATRTKDVGLKGRGIGRHSRESQMDAAKKEDKALGTVLKRCFCTLKLQNQKQAVKRVKKERPMHQGTATPVTKEVPSLQTRSVMTVHRPKPFPYKLEPYECEPGVCIPGECDPYECQKRINRRLMYRESGTLTDRHRTRSTSNMIRPYRKHRDSAAQSVMQRKKHLKSRDIQSKVRRPKPRTARVARSSRQAVKIGSKFSFDIELSKDRSLASSITSSRPIQQYSTYEKPRRTVSRFSGGRSISSRNKRAQRTRAVRDMDSQVLARKMRSTMTGVGPFLKRCFCTLHLHKMEKDKNPYTSIATRTEKIKTHPKTNTRIAKESTYRNPRKQADFYSTKLEPYECEPGVCVPGQCDPYECEKRIKRRMLSKDSSTEPHRGRSVSSSIAESTKCRPRRTQARCYAPCSKNVNTCPGDGQLRVKERVTYDTSPNRQAVRIGSSFSFNVEFFKDKSPQLPTQRDVHKIPKIKQIHTDIRESETRAISTKSMSSYSRRARLQDCQSQSDCVKTECKASCAPLLKRCFCTLKLQKMGKQQQHTKVEPTTKTMGTGTPYKNKVDILPTAREMGTKTRKYAFNLEPYECEPGFCIPGQCDPYECEKRIKLRNMRNYGTETNRAVMKSMSSLTFRHQGTKAMNTQIRKEKHYAKRKPSTETIYRPKKTPRVSHVKNLNRQAVRLGSNFSFNIEFFKDRSLDLNDTYNNDIQSYYKQPAIKPAKHKSRTSISTANRIKSRNHGTYGREKHFNNRESQVGASTESRGSGMGPLLKRCFCTLTLQRAEVKNTLNTPVKVNTQDKTTSTKKKYIPPSTQVQQLEPYECEPNVCILGECDPYECLERIKKRGVRRMSRTTGTRMKRSSQVSTSSMAAQLMPGYRSKRTQLKEICPPRKVERIVEEPRFPFLCGNANTRQTVRISSNFDFNIEFIKEYSPEQEARSGCPDKEVCRTKDLCTRCNKSGPSKLKMKIGQHGTRASDLQSQESQSERVNTEDKSSAVAMLRRCFCTAKLHKSHLARTHPQTLTVGRVENIKPFPVFGPKEYCVQYQIHKPALCKYCKSTDNSRHKEETGSYSNRGTNPNKLETIMSYTPSKFRKTSRIPDSIEQNTPKARSKTIGKGRKQSKITEESQETNDSTIRKMLCRCKYLFKRHTNENFQQNEVKSTEIRHADLLKPSKSEGRPNNTATAGLKKSKSLKVATERNVHRKTFSRFESGDADQTDIPNKSQNSTKKYVTKTCPCCQAQFKQDISTNKQVHFSVSANSNLKLQHGKRNDAALLRKSMTERDEVEEGNKSVTSEIKGSKYKNTKELKCLQLCSCCGGVKTKRTTDHGLDAKTTKKHKLSLDAKTTNKHKLSCPCCICKKSNNTGNIGNTGHPGNTDNIGNTGNTSNIRYTGNTGKTGKTGNTGAKLTKTGKTTRKKVKPDKCVCGSPTCKKVAELQAEGVKVKLRRSKRKKCVCGTEICAAESLKEAKLAESGFKRRLKKKKSAKMRQLEQKLREEMFRKEDEEISRRRKLNDKYMLKKLKKYKETNDVLLLAESVLDIGKLGITSAGDILRNVFRTITDPVRTYRNIKMYLQNPTRAWKKFQDAANDGPGVATLKRIKLRCQAMQCVQQSKAKLEENAVTNYMVHINDDDPKRRLHPKRPRRQRLDPSFGCSPFMLSLRKRPWLGVYYMCSWFYPHCLSILQVWRQFSDIILFLLAVVVWCPCIAGMEICRAMMCCFLCTG